MIARSPKRTRSPSSRVTALLVAAVALVAGAATAVGSAPASGGVPVAAGFGSNWTVYHHDTLGSGTDPTGTNLSPATPAWTSVALDGQIYGEPLVQDGRVIVATENNTVYALAADSGAVLWSTHIASPVPSVDLPCGDISPQVGITSTPVIDPSLHEIFVVADELTGSNGASHHLVGLDLRTGAIELDSAADPPGSHPLFQLQRPGLTLDDGQVIVAYGGNAGDCENPANPYHGWVVALPEEGGPGMSTFEVAANPGDSQGAIWMGGAAPIVDSNGTIWVATGNSKFRSPQDAYDGSDAVLALSPQLTLERFFAPVTWPSDNASDLDLGSSSPDLMSDGLGLQAGKSQNAYVFSQSSPGGIGHPLATRSSYCGTVVDGGSAVSGDTVYTPCAAGVVKTLVTPGNPPTITSVWRSATGSGGPPILAGSLVWTIDHAHGMLYGLNPSTGQASQTFALGTIANHFPTPTVADGLLLAPAGNTIHAFDGPAGLPPPPLPLPASPPAGGLATSGPARILDTRNGTGGFGPIPPHAALVLNVDGRDGVPASGVGAVVLNVTVTEPQASGFLTVYQSGVARPSASSLNFVAGQTVSNLVVAPAAGGQVNIYNGSPGTVQLVVDMSGWFASGGPSPGGLAPVGPVRILDTRVGTGGVRGPVAGDTPTVVPVEGQGGVPASGVQAVVLNVTVTEPQASGFITAYPDGTPRPSTSNLNFVANQTVPNLVIVPVGADGKVDLYNRSPGDVQLVVDVSGWLAAGTSPGGGFTALAAARLLDTRSGSGPVAADSPVRLAVEGHDGVPASCVAAVVLNVTVTEPQAGGFITVYADGATRPVTSNLNFAAGQTAPILVIAPVGADGQVDLYNRSPGSVQLVVDVFGWFSCAVG